MSEPNQTHKSWLTKVKQIVSTTGWRNSSELALTGLVSIVLLIVTMGIVVSFRWVNPEDADARIEYLKTIAQILAGLAVLTGLYFTYQTVKTSQENTRLTRVTVENATAQLQIDRDAKVAELFYKASEQLGDKVNEQRRVAGLYSLERIANNHDEYYQQCIDVICSFINSQHKAYDPHEGYDRSYVPPVDLTAAVRVLCLRKQCYGEGEAQILRFVNVDFRSVDFTKGDLCRARFEGCNLAGATLGYTRFENTEFINCSMDHSHWSHSDMRGANFQGCDMSSISFEYMASTPWFRTESYVYGASETAEESVLRPSHRVPEEFDVTHNAYELLNYIRCDDERFIKRVTHFQAMVREYLEDIFRDLNREH